MYVDVASAISVSVISRASTDMALQMITFMFVTFNITFVGVHHTKEEFSVRGKEPKDEVQIYTWKDATLRELTDLVQRRRIASHLAVLTPLAYRSSVQKPRPRTCIKKDFPRRSSSSIPT